jgi:hypothetical protein
LLYVLHAKLEMFHKSFAYTEHPSAVIGLPASYSQ